MSDIDQILDGAFTPERVAQAFYDYKRAKWDHFSGLDDDADIEIPLGVDGVKWQGFEKQLWRNARNISRRIHEGTYLFHPFREVNVRKDVSLPSSADNTRKLGIASIRDALVQMVLYAEVLSERAEGLFAELDQPDPVSFGYRRGKSPAHAALRIRQCIAAGYSYVYDADLSKYFDTIPHDLLLKKVAQVTGGDDSRTYALIRRFIRVDRTPHASYRGAKLRGNHVGVKVFHEKKPKRCRRAAGVPQGGTLSGLLANLYLHDFDRWITEELSQTVDLRYIRYADDFVVMVREAEALQLLGQQIPPKLESDEYGLTVNTCKTKPLDIQVEDLEFVGFRFDRSQIRVRDKSIRKFQTRFQHDVLDAVSATQKRSGYEWTLNHIVKRTNYKIQGLAGADRCPVCRCNRVGPPRSWLAAFRVVTDDSQLRELDKWIRESIYDWMYTTFGVRVRRAQLVRLHLQSLVDEIHHVRRARTRPCLCDIRESIDGVWGYAGDLYQGRCFSTLGRHKPFTVPFVDDTGLQVSIGGSQHHIRKDTITAVWDRMLGGETVTRVGLEREGVRCTSQIAALLAELPAVDVSLAPIALRYSEPPIAKFLLMPDNDQAFGPMA